MQDNPILVEVMRGSLVESCHRGAVAIADDDGRVLLGVGDIERPVYPRSAVKAMQALPLIESGAADAFRLGDKELAIACASHSGEEAHIDAVRSLLAKAGLDKSQLACGAHWPIGERASRELMRAGKSPTAIHNNCSGKHAGMLAVAVHRGLDPVGYERLGHPVQQEIRRILSETCGIALEADAIAYRRLLGADLRPAARRRRHRSCPAREREGPRAWAGKGITPAHGRLLRRA